MKHATQVTLIHQIFDAIDRGTPPMAERFTRNDTSAYTSPQRAAREREVLFRNHPIVAGFSSQIPNPGDYLTEDLLPVPIMVVRNTSGELRAFVNICRHRGAKLVSGCGHTAKLFSCPYHAWSYDTDGRLVAIPDDYGFEGLDRAASGLVALPVAEKYGLIFVTPTPADNNDNTIDIDAMLAGLGEDIDSYGIASMAHQETRVVRRRMNWKLMSDTFWEAYHIKVLHAQNVAPLFIKNLAMFDAFGRNTRYIGVRKSIEKLRDLPQEKWDLVPHTTILMNLFPNTILVMQSDHAEIYRIFPAGTHVGESVATVSILAPEPSPKWSRTMDLLLGVVDQDFTLGEGIQHNFESGAQRKVIYGRYENALEHFHRSIREAIGEV
jgi:phenylpropionate dioxygenase-like ring-hydroxylating dioxygenase large terminal subunit